MRLDHLLSRVLEQFLRKFALLMFYNAHTVKTWALERINAFPITSQLLRKNPGLVAQLVRALC